jgi:hypothetical protein
VVPLFYRVQTGSGVHPTCYSTSAGGLSPKEKLTHISPPSTEVKMSRSLGPLPQVISACTDTAPYQYAQQPWAVPRCVRLQYRCWVRVEPHTQPVGKCVRCSVCCVLCSSNISGEELVLLLPVLQSHTCATINYREPSIFQPTSVGPM